MNKNSHSVIQQCLTLMIQPVIEFCVSRGVHFQDFLEIAKKGFVHAAENKLRSSSESEPSVSRLSVMTGLQRPEVVRLRRKETERTPRDFITRVLGQWGGDKRFLDRKRLPKALSFSGTSSEFRKLVHAVSKDLNPHTVRFELERLGLIEEKEGLIYLTQPVYLSTGDVSETLRFASEDVRDLIIACEENAFAASITPNLHARTQYDNIPDESIPEIKNWLLELGGEIHARVRAYLSKKDRDISPTDSAGSGRNRVIIGTFSRIEVIKKERKEMS